jgi:predicted transcriptional regulator
MRNRDRMDIISRILDTAANSGSGGATKTKMIYNAFLSYAQLKGYLTTLIDNHLLRYDSLSQKFKTTEKGLRFLKAYNQMDEIMKAPQQQQF